MKPAILGVVFGLASIAYAQIAKYCPSDENNVCYSVNVPSQSASSDSGDIYFQIQGPSSLQWIALGQGGQMAGANMFIIYSDASGMNVTLSPRLGRGNFQPNYDSQAQVSLLEGSGVSNGMMTANVRCSSCVTWSGGSMSLTDSSSTWMWAVKEGPSIRSDSPSENLQQHTDMDQFSFDLTKAQGGNSLNPFQDSSASSTAASGSAPTSAASSDPQDGGNGDSDDDGNNESDSNNNNMSSGSSDGSSSGSSRRQSYNTKVVAHGVLMSLAFLIFFPFGALTIRLLSFSGLVWVHAGAQLFAYAIALAGFGIGVWMAVTTGQSTCADQTKDMVLARQLRTTHPLIGIVVISLLIFQPILGLIHHFIYRRQQRRTLWAHAHIWYGRTLLILGVINGGLGLDLADNTTKGEIAYGVIAGVVFLIYVTVVVVGAIKSRGKREGETGEKMLGS